MPMTMKALDIAKVCEDKDRLSYLRASRFGSKSHVSTVQLSTHPSFALGSVLQCPKWLLAYPWYMLA
jgi:hypothetical protein